MKSNELLQEVLHEYGIKRAAAELGLSESCLYKWCESDGGKASGVLNPLERVAILYRLTGDPRLLHWLCAQGNGFFVANPPVTTPPPTLLVAENRMQHEVLEFLGAVTAAAAKGNLSSADADTLQTRWEQAKSVTESFVTAAQRGLYRLVAFFFPAVWFASASESALIVGV